jgi:hypothetical protein
MKKTIKYVIRTILAILGFTAVCVLMGEPTESLSVSEVILHKALSLVVIVVAFKLYLLTLSKQERSELDDEQV